MAESKSGEDEGSANLPEQIDSGSWWRPALLPVTGGVGVDNNTARRLLPSPEPRLSLFGLIR
uniref:Uncharacterized protein n=1 Tax=Oryza punctata TaxID=4537 RepID=A0A0E0M433_ORYPU